MKLHLHWLRFDLHRFRLLLGVWTLLVAAYAVFLGWVHLRFLTIRPEIMDRSLYIAILLGLVELCFLFALFNADPAKGPGHFWRTRPPSGTAVAGSKLVLALAFFVALPLLAWWAVNAFCVLQEYAITQSPTGLPWTAFLFWTQALVVSVFAMAAARSAGKKEFYLHLFASTAMVAFAVWALQEIWIWVVRAIWNEFGISSLDVRLGRWLGNGFGTLPMAALTLGAASLYLLLVRRRRLPSGHGLASLMLLPVGALFCAATVFTIAGRKPAGPGFRDAFLPPVDPTAAIQIHVMEMPLHPGSFRAGEYSGSSDSAGEPFSLLQSPPRPVEFSTILRVEGLPPGARVSARWLDLKLTAPDGRTVHADIRRGGRHSQEIRQGGPDHLYPAPVSFLKHELEPWFTDRTTADGTLRLTLYVRKKQPLPLPDGQTHDTLQGPLLMQRRRGDFFKFKEQAERSKWPPLPEEVILDSMPDRIRFFDFATFNPWHPAIDFLDGQPSGFYLAKGKEEIPLRVSRDSPPHPTGFLIRHQLRSGSASIWTKKNYSKDPAIPYIFENPDLLKAVYTGRNPPEGWQLGVESSEPYGTVDLPVSLHDVIPGTGWSIRSALLRALSSVHLRENDTLEKIRSDLRYAYGLVSGMPRTIGYGGSTRQWRQAVDLWKGVLDQVPHAHLPVLLEMIKDRTWPLALYGQSTEGSLRAPSEDAKSPSHIIYLLRKRAAELIQPADRPSILADPELMEGLRPFLRGSAPSHTSDSAPEAQRQ